MFVEKYNVKNY